jgi:hypothetical protein
LALYESDDRTTAILTKSAGIFFSDLNIILIEYCFLMICRITDPEESLSRKNLTISYINSELAHVSLLTPEISKISENILHYRETIKGARNKLISHLDVESITGNSCLGGHEEEKVKVFFENLNGYVDLVGNALDIGPLDFSALPGPGDVIDLIKTLNRGLTAIAR